MTRRGVPTWERFELLSWAAAILSILMFLTPAWAPTAEGSWSTGTVRNVAPVLSWTDASTLHASDANGEQDLFELVVLAPDGARATLSLPLPPSQGIVLDGHEAFIVIRDERAHDGAVEITWKADGASATWRAFAVDHGGAVSNIVTFPAPPLRPSPRETRADRALDAALTPGAFAGSR